MNFLLWSLLVWWVGIIYLRENQSRQTLRDLRHSSLVWTKSKNEKSSWIVRGTNHWFKSTTNFLTRAYWVYAMTNVENIQTSVLKLWVWKWSTAALLWRSLSLVRRPPPHTQQENGVRYSKHKNTVVRAFSPVGRAPHFLHRLFRVTVLWRGDCVSAAVYEAKGGGRPESLPSFTNTG